MKIIKVDATTSTNSLARILNQENSYKKFCISAEFQTQGRGQHQSSWQSSRSKNIMTTVVFNQLELDINKQFLLNALVCLRLYFVLKKYDLPELKLKWPNDILADHYKICGILIENTLNQDVIKSAYIGIGLNVNQMVFEDLPQASSLKKILGKTFDREQLLQEIIEELETLPKDLKENSAEKIINTYKNHLYKFKTESQFILSNDEVHSAVIKDVALDGQMLVEFKSGKQSYFQHKAINQLY